MRLLDLCKGIQTNRESPGSLYNPLVEITFSFPAVKVTGHIMVKIIYSTEKEEHRHCQALFHWDQHKLRSNTQYPSNRTHHEDQTESGLVTESRL